METGLGEDRRAAGNEGGTLKARTAPDRVRNYVGLAILLLVALGVWVFLLRGTAAEAQPAETPEYEVIEESLGEDVRELVVGTGARGEEELRLVAEDLAEELPVPEDGVLLVEFRDDPEADEDAGRFGLRETGFALVFDSEEAALAEDLRYDEEEARRIVEEEGGIRVVSFADFGEENPDLLDDLQSILR